MIIEIDLLLVILLALVPIFVLLKFSFPKPSIKKRFRILYATKYGSAQKLAKQFYEELSKQSNVKVSIKNLKEFNADTLSSKKDVTYIFFLSTHYRGQPPDSGKPLLEYLKDTVNDFRVSRNHFSHIKYVLFGLGDSVYEKEHFNKFARDVDQILYKLGADRLCSSKLGDASKDIQMAFSKWTKHVIPILMGEKVIQKRPRKEVKEEQEETNKLQEIDIEDVGDKISGELITHTLRKNLTKQGYKLVGTHSAVKLCRWTKSMLRGRGGCYKHSAYGISSFQCMEATTCLACANRCFFCWRHGSNPVGKDWRWKVDDPELILRDAIENHQKMIKNLRGMAGVIEKRIHEGMTVKHCALSLVGESILYPKINEFCALLHAKKISTFLVTNAQYPDRVKQLGPVTQLYLSIDAPNKEELQKCDLPVFSDFWERFLKCIDYLSEKKYRTVFRMTLVKGNNMNDAEGYAKLIARGKPCFVEIKGVTYSGATDKMTMQQVPYHTEVLSFCQKLVKLPELSEYEIAVEHEHSCFVLIAHKKFKINNEWHTWIDYEKFHQLIKEGKDFTALDYSTKTPYWALYQSAERGFDPAEVRYKKKKPVKEFTNVQLE